MKKSKLFAPFLMLLAGAVSSISMYCFHYTMGEMLPVLLIVLIVFYVAGSLIQKNILSFMNQIMEKEEALRREAAEREAREEAAREEAAQAAQAAEEGSFKENGKDTAGRATVEL